MWQDMRKLIFPAVMVGVLAGCQDLLVENTNQADRERALANPSDVEVLAFGSWSLHWLRIHGGSDTYRVMPNVGDIGTAVWTNSASLELSSEPRVAFNNDASAQTSTPGEAFWYRYYTMLSNSNEALIAIASGLVIEGDGGEDNTLRTQVWAKFMQGLALGHLGMFYDQAFIATEDTDLSLGLNLVPYQDVLAAAELSMAVAIALAATGSFELVDVVPGLTISEDEVQRLAHSYSARFMVYGARTPAERENLDWAAVMSHVNNGIVAGHAPFVDSDFRSQFIRRFSRSSLRWGRTDLRLLGPADISGAYQAWHAVDWNQRDRFDIVTPDRRITGETNDPTSQGKYYRYASHDGGFDPTRGVYHRSPYVFWRHDGEPRDVNLTIMSTDEMALIMAEALYRTGNLGGAADLVNTTSRVPNGELPPLTAAGVPAGADCVPKTSTGACGDLLYAIHYERLMENGWLDSNIGWQDRRGFGTLSEGAWLSFPVPARELETVGIPVYNLGGIGGTHAAPAPIGG